MSRIALIGQNSVEYVDKLLTIWNDGDSAVLIDWQIPIETAVRMMNEAAVKKCFIEQKVLDKVIDSVDNEIQFIAYDSLAAVTKLLPEEIRLKYSANYSHDEAVVIYSSGTTGKAKGIILSHYAITANADAIIDYMQPSDRDCIYIVKNLTHSSTITGELLVALKTRTPILIAPVVVPPRFVLSNIAKYGVTIIGVNPLLLSMYCEECRSREYDLSTLKKIYVSGSILGEKTFKMAHAVFCRQEVYNVYGLSEAGPRVAAQQKDCCKGNSVGKAIKGVEIIIVDDCGNIVTNGVRGIVHVNTPSRFNGYITGEVKHKSLYKDWLNTGDVGYFDEYGELHIVGRVDDVIFLGAHKIYPSDVVTQILRVADIDECVVTMVHSCSEDILCCLYSAPSEIRGDIKNRLGTVVMKYEIPKIFVRTESIPKTRNGKVSLQSVKDIIIRELEGRKPYESR